MNKSVIACSALALLPRRAHQMRRRDFPEGLEEKKEGLMGSFVFGYAHDSNAGFCNGSGTNNNEDFLIEDLSEFSNEDIAAPIESLHDSPLHQQSDFKSDCTADSSSASDPFQRSDSDLQTAFPGPEIQEPLLSLPKQDETEFEWLGSLGDDNLLCSAASYLDFDSFLLNTVAPFSGTFDGMLKHSECGNALWKEQDMEMSQKFVRATCGMAPKCPQADHETGSSDYDETGSRPKSLDVGLQTGNSTDFAAPAPSRSARSKRLRTASGWSSGGILCERGPENPSPTHSLQSSTSQISDELLKGTPQQSGWNTGFMCSQEEGCTTTSSSDINKEIQFDASLTGRYNGDNVKKLSSTENSVLEEDSTREENASNSYGGGGLQTRRCAHCQSQKTPQWRAGPMGPKTLCNACGVRYKSGRLFEEYRPAKSPTFLSYRHSNSHKKVMEMRRRKTVQYSQHQRLQHMTPQHRVQASPMPQTDGGNQSINGNVKVRVHNVAPRAHVEFPCPPHFSDVTLIRTRNSMESPSNFLY